ncbi:MAG: hypothetical protein ACR2NI_12530 [Pirellulales bacterium]
MFRKSTIAITVFGYDAELAEADGFTYYNKPLSGKGNQYSYFTLKFLKGAYRYILLILTENPVYVATENNEKLLDKVLADYVAENPKPKTMSFTAIKRVLANRYKIDTQSAGLFFRNQVKVFDTEGGNRNKMVLIRTKRVTANFGTMFSVFA